LIKQSVFKVVNTIVQLNLSFKNYNKMLLPNRLKNQHLLWRAGFGPTAENAASLDGITAKQLWELLLKTSGKKAGKKEVAGNLNE